MQVSTQQLVGMARLTDNAAVWSKRMQYGRFRPPGWITVQQAQQQRPGWRQRVTLAGADCAAAGGSNAGSRAGPASGQLVPTARAGVGAPVSWQQVWQYAGRAVLEDLRERRRLQGWRTALKSDVTARRRYVHLYQQKLDSLQPAPPPAAAAPAASTPSTPAAAPAGDAPAPAAAAGAAGKASDEAGDGDADTVAPPADTGHAAAAGAAVAKESAAAVLSELQRLEQQLSVEDILLCRSLAELALERLHRTSTGALHMHERSRGVMLHAAGRGGCAGQHACLAVAV
jgi:hypothetical protein